MTGAVGPLAPKGRAASVRSTARTPPPAMCDGHSRTRGRARCHSSGTGTAATGIAGSSRSRLPRGRAASHSCTRGAKASSGPLSRPLPSAAPSSSAKRRPCSVRCASRNVSGRRGRTAPQRPRGSPRSVRAAAAAPRARTPAAGRKPRRGRPLAGARGPRRRARGAPIWTGPKLRCLRFRRRPIPWRARRGRGCRIRQGAAAGPAAAETKGFRALDAT